MKGNTESHVAIILYLLICFLLKCIAIISFMSEDWITRQTLLMRVKNQDDEQAWDEFVSYYRTFIKVILKYLNVSENDVEDLTQDILLKIWKAFSKLDYNAEKARFRTWMNTVIRNAVIDFHRARNRKIKTIDNKEEIKTDSFPLGKDEFTRIIDKEWRAHITNLALENIRPEFNGNAMDVFNMCLDGVTTKIIAEKLDLAEASVYKLRKRVEDKLVKEIKRLKTELEF